MNKKILIIEDDPDILSILEIIFVDEGFETILRQSGTDAVEVSVLHPDLILLDIRIYGSAKNGVEICQELKSSAAVAQIPVVLLSAERDLENIASGCQADGYLSKPFDVDLLIGKVKEFLS